MTLKKKLLTTAVGASLALGVGAANAFFDRDFPSILFPYVVKDANRTTVVTVISTSGSRSSNNQDLHIQYWTKSTTDANTAACQPSSSFMKITPNDIVSFDTAGILGTGPLFGDTTNAAPLGASIAYAGPRHGFLLVDDISNQVTAGFWMEVDLANGGAHGGPGLHNQGQGNDFDNTVDQAFKLNNDGSNPVSLDGASPVIFWPASVASTVFTVTPLGDDMLNSDNNTAVLQVFNTGQLQGAYDRNENGIDGTVPQTVRCVGRLTAAQLMPGVVANAAWAATGGWGYLANLGDNATTGPDRDVVVYQVDTSTAAGAGKFMSNATMISSELGGGN